NQILRDAPPTCRFVFASRGKPRLQFARFKTHGGYAALGTDLLRFTEPEIDELFRDIYKSPLDASDLAELERRTEGWAASLQLVEVSLRDRRTPEERREFIQSISAATDSDLFEFLAEEVLDQQSEETRTLLLATSILQQVTPELAERLAGVHDGTRGLMDLEGRGLFTYRLDDNRYRYHHLFRDFLERRLAMEHAEAEVAGLHIHAASYFETTEQWPEAIHHYLRAGLQRQAARLLAKHGEELAEAGRLELIDEWVQELPEKSIRENARLSLLYGETTAFRGEWAAALGALNRARAYFVRKGDRRMQALACLKLSAIHHYRGDHSVAAECAREGLRLVPSDAIATRLRLEGNLAITHGLANDHIESVAQTCKRIAVEATAHGYDYFAAIAFHNVGVFSRWMGRIDEATESLEKAANFAALLPPNPLSDNHEFVICLLYRNKVARAEELARSGVSRTRPWRLANAIALQGLAEVLAYQGKLSEAIATVTPLLADVEALGFARNSIGSLIETMYLAGSPVAEMESALSQLQSVALDDREGSPGLAAALVTHRRRTGCKGECLRVSDDAAKWEARGATLVATCVMVKLGVLVLEHTRGRAPASVVDALRRAGDLDLLRYLRGWVRLYAPHSRRIASDPVGATLMRHLVEADPEGWRIAAAAALSKMTGPNREGLLEALVHHANRDLVDALRNIQGPDIAFARHLLIQRQAARIFVRTFGAMTVHRGSWTGPEIEIDKRRLRALLGLLAAHSGRILSRDEALDILWPDADPSSAINSLNQAVFQLRRLLDPAYRDGESPQYILSTTEAVELNHDLVRTDLAEVRRLARRHEDAADNDEGDVLAATVSLVRGEFLPDLKYEDWATEVQTAIHSELRAILVPIAERARPVITPDLAVQAALALIRLDEYDERAQVALAIGLSEGGRRIAARDSLTRFAKKMQEEFDEDPSSLVAAAMARISRSSNRN
ncbi:MAG: winged helix-turn-helix domain-containing protein, partial [Candidatus Limnocylindria bacterium]